MMLNVPCRRTIGAIHQEIVNKENVPLQFYTKHWLEMSKNKQDYKRQMNNKNLRRGSGCSG
jgi:hypothetical protein